MIYRTIVDNVIALNRSAEMDLTGDETSWAHQGYGESGSNIIKRIQNKPGVNKGGQTVLVSATNRIRPYWYQHRHNKNTRYPSEGMNAEGPAEVRTFIDEMNRIISTLKIDGNVDYLFEGFAMVTNRYTNSYQDADLTTRNKDEKSVTYVRSAEAFH